MPSLGAYLTVSNAAAAIDFYKAAFGAVEEARMPGEDGKIMHAELRLFGGAVMLSDEFPEFGNTKSPLTLGGTSFNMIATVDTRAAVDAAYDRALAAGGAAVMPPADMFWGARFAMLRDPFGHLWAFNAD